MVLDLEITITETCAETLGLSLTGDWPRTLLNADIVALRFWFRVILNFCCSWTAASDLLVFFKCWWHVETAE